MSRPTLRSFVRSCTLLAALPAMAAAQCGWTLLPGAAASGPDGPVLCALALPNGDLVAGGSFRVADGAIVNHLARWDGATWHGIGGGFDGQVVAIARMANGDLIAAGQFATAGGVPANRIARWNGSVWAPVGAGFAGDIVHALTLLPNGDIVAASNLTSAASSSGHYGLQRYDGVSWQHVPGLDAGLFPVVTRVVTLANGGLALSGNFSVGFVPGEVAIFDAATSTMQLLPVPVGGGVRSLLAASNGELWIGGAANATLPSLARWNGTAWSPVAGAPGNILALAEDGAGRVIVGASPAPPWPNTNAAARFDGVAWQSLGSTALPPVVQAIAELGNGDVIVGGRFSLFHGVAAPNLARWNGTAWSSIGSGVDGEVRALAALPGGGFVVGGLFAHAGGAPAQRVARFDGQHWSTLGAGLAATPVALAVTPQGTIFVCSACRRRCSRCPAEHLGARCSCNPKRAASSCLSPAAPRSRGRSRTCPASSAWSCARRPSASSSTRSASCGWPAATRWNW